MTEITAELTKPLLIDGAMSTALEQLGADTNNSLWTASVLANQPALVKKVHQEYFKAGARLEITDTYQANVPAFIKNGYSKQEAHSLIQRAVALAKEARDEYQQETGIYNYVAGALGPYGAYLANGSEYSGDYHLSTTEYQQFHRPRLTDILTVGVDVIAIETQPRLDEVLTELDLVKELAPDILCYVSFSLKDPTHLPDGTPLAVAARTVAKYPNVFAVGVNCIPLEEVTAAIETIHQATDKPVIALVADLSADQRATVLSLMGVTEQDLANYTVITITNEDEHKYLDSYVDPAVIGTRALSSVMVTPAEAGHGVMVTTQNINYCTTGMYRNALLTAGVEDADIMVVGPTEISGTAGLIGAVKAYEQVSGEPISDETLDTAMNELVTTGELVTKSASDEEVEALIAYIKAKLAAGELETEDDIRNEIKEGEQKFDVSLDESEEQQIVDFMLKIKKLGLDPNVLLDQAADLYSKFGDELLNKATDDGFFSGLGNIVNSIADFFKGLFKK